MDTAVTLNEPQAIKSKRKINKSFIPYTVFFALWVFYALPMAIFFSWALNGVIKYTQVGSFPVFDMYGTPMMVFSFILGAAAIGLWQSIQGLIGEKKQNIEESDKKVLKYLIPVFSFIVVLSLGACILSLYYIDILFSNYQLIPFVTGHYIETGNPALAVAALFISIMLIGAALALVGICVYNLKIRNQITYEKTKLITIIKFVVLFILFAISVGIIAFNTLYVVIIIHF